MIPQEFATLQFPEIIGKILKLLWEVERLWNILQDNDTNNFWDIEIQ
jgi:hypothetical protein